jgi:hypothetical protein
LKFGILTRREDSYSTSQLKDAFKKNNIDPFCFSFKDIVVHIGEKERFFSRGVNLLKDLDVILVRPIGKGTLEEIIFQIDLLHRI